MARQVTTRADYFRLGEWIVKPEQRVLERGGQWLEIGAKAMDVLVHLAECAGEVVSAEQLLIECWRGTFYGDNPVHKAIAELRKHLGDQVHSPTYILTIRKRGYRLIAPTSFPDHFTGGGVRGVQPGAMVHDAVEAWAEGSPFCGLQPFDASHAAVFFGRSGATAQILQALRQQRETGRSFLLCMGPSGCGKTSLIRAGVLPLLMQRGGFDGMSACSVADMSSMGEDLMVALAYAMLVWRIDDWPIFAAGELASLVAALRTSPELVAARVTEALSGTRLSSQIALGMDKMLVLVVDALEQMLADAHFDEHDRHVFTLALDALARSGSVLVLATCRNDFYPRLVKQPVLIELKQGSGLYDVKPMTRGEIAQMIRRPARAAALTYARDSHSMETLDDVIRDAAAQHPEALPLLQYTLQELYIRRSDTGELSFAAYHAIGGLEGALGTRAEAIFQQMGQDAQRELPWLLQHLVLVQADEEGITGRRMARSQADTGGRQQLVQSLVDARLLVSELAFGEPVVSVAHEALLRHWPRVVDWIDGNRAALQTRTRLAVLAQRWQREIRRRDLLLPQGRLLDEARALLGNPVVSLTDEELVFIEYSSRQAKWARRARMSTISLVALLGVTAAVAAGMASRARREADRRRAGAENLIGFMLGDLSERLKPLGRLDLLDRVSSEALRYLADDATTEAKRPRDTRDVDSDADLYRAKALLQLGGISLARADQAQAQSAFSHAMNVLQRLHDRSSDNTDVLEELGKAYYWLGYIRYRQHDMLHAEEAWRHYREYARQRRALDPHSIDAMLELSYAYNNLGTLESSLGSKSEAIANFQKSIGLKRQVLSVQPTNEGVTVELADSLSWVGTSLEHEGKLLNAGKYYQQELDLLRQARVSDPTAALWRFREANAHSHIANLAVQTGDFAVAQTHYSAARDILTDIVSKQPDNRSWQGSLAVLKIELGELHLLMHQPAAARTLLAQAIPTMRHLLELDASVISWKRQLGLAHRILALAQARLGQSKAAHGEALQAVGIMESTALAADHDPVTRTGLAQALIVLGKIEQAAGDNDAAAASWHRALEILAGLVPNSTDPRILVPWVQVQTCLHHDGLAAPFIHRLQSWGYREPIDPPLHH